MNSEDGIPESVLGFIGNYIDSLEQLEVLLLLWHGSNRSFGIEAITQKLGSSQHSIGRRLATLARLGLVEPRDGGFRYRSEPMQDALVAQVDQCYHERRVSVTIHIINRVDLSLRNFSDAFHLRKPPGSS